MKPEATWSHMATSPGWKYQLDVSVAQLELPIAQGTILRYLMIHPHMIFYMQQYWSFSATSTCQGQVLRDAGRDHQWGSPRSRHSSSGQLCHPWSASCIMPTTDMSQPRMFRCWSFGKHRFDIQLVSSSSLKDTFPSYGGLTINLIHICCSI